MSGSAATTVKPPCTCAWWADLSVPGIFLINLAKTWDKLMLAARIIVTVENPQDVCVISARPYGQRAVLKYAQYTGAQARSPPICAWVL